ncbi:MAG: hypothetical protein NTZ38_00175 [Candidatus Taylorbacteria bacterium]|nr:hypothetical protein [Candidatus Taylorbacteria bacterium]
MTKAIAYTYTVAQEYRRYITQAFIYASLIMALIYGINVYLVISRAVATEGVNRETASLQSSVQELDARYISLSNQITPDAAASFGLHEAVVTAYIQKAPLLGRAVLSMRQM